MKKIFILLLVIVIACGLCVCACASTPNEVPEGAEYIGYAIIPHADGDEYADIYNWFIDDGVVCAQCLDGRFIASPQIIVVLEP
jgi:hypothetical protein